MTMNGVKIKNDLEETGYAVVPIVLTIEECDEYRKEYEAWLKGFGTEWPLNKNSVIHSYKIGYSSSTWAVRLGAKKVFSALWGTEKLLTSIDGMAIGRPPEEGQTNFAEPGKHTLHQDQPRERIGTHAVQGAVYLEEACDDDYCMMFVEKSHKFHEEFFAIFPPGEKQVLRSVKENELDWLKEKGCTVKRVGCPKGGMILWDSQTVHAGAAPLRGRANPGRWRFVVFVCMGPSQWADEKDIATKTAAFYNLEMTHHWPDKGLGTFDDPRGEESRHIVSGLPEITKRKDILELVGVERYDFQDGKPNGPSWVPKFRK